MLEVSWADISIGAIEPRSERKSLAFLALCAVSSEARLEENRRIL